MATVRKLPSGTYQFIAYGVDKANPKERKRFYKTWNPSSTNLKKKAFDAEFAAALGAFELEVRGGVSLKGECTLADFYDYWHDSIAVPTLAPKTVLQYEYLWPRVNQQLGHLRLKDVDAARIQEFFGWLQSTAKNGKTGEPLSKNTVRLHRMLLSSMFREAVAKEFVTFNPCTGQRVTLPPLDAKPAYSCTTEDVESLKAQIAKEPPVFRAMVTLLLNAGLRKGELHGLQWSDFNPSTGTITIERQLQYIQQKGFITCETKSKTGMRSFKLPAPAVAALLEWQTEQSKWRETIGTEIWGTGYGRKFTTVRNTVTGRDWPTSAPWMFTDEYGSPRYPDSLHKRFKAFLQRAGLTEEEVKAIHPHTLRHTNASIMVAKGVDYATTAARLGDSQQTVMKYYAHAQKEADEKAAATLEAVFT